MNLHICISLPTSFGSKVDRLSSTEDFLAPHPGVPAAAASADAVVVVVGEVGVRRGTPAGYFSSACTDVMSCSAVATCKIKGVMSLDCRESAR
jgi:hypothetical protein